MTVGYLLFLQEQIKDIIIITDSIVDTFSVLTSDQLTGLQENWFAPITMSPIMVPPNVCVCVL